MQAFFTVVYGKSVRHLDHITAETDEEADRLSEIAFNAVDWGEVKQSAIDAWNTRADGWIGVADESFSATQTAIVYIPLEKGFYMNMVTSNDEGDLYDMDGGYIGYHASQITHWMPLPAPPKAAK